MTLVPGQASGELAGPLRDRDARSRRMVAATVFTARLGEQPIMVRNLSARGIRARTRSQPLMPGERIVLRLQGQDVEGEVRWTRNDDFGAALDRALDLSAFDFSGKSWNGLFQPQGHHVHDRFRPESDFRRPGFRQR